MSVKNDHLYLVAVTRVHQHSGCSQNSILVPHDESPSGSQADTHQYTLGGEDKYNTLTKPFISTTCQAMKVSTWISVDILWFLGKPRLTGQEKQAGLPRWQSRLESTCQSRRQVFNPWFGRIPHATEQLSPRTTTEPELWVHELKLPKPARREPVLSNKRSATVRSLRAITKSTPARCN